MSAEQQASGAVALLEWYIEAGADEAIGDKPVDRYLTKPAAAPREPRPAEPRKPRPTIQEAIPLEAADTTAQGARELAAGCRTLAELRAALEDFDACPLKKTATNLVFADGNPEAGLMLVGEAPGADEDRQGLPFVGVSGKLLDKMLLAIGRDRDDAYITNILPWRPPGNRKPTPFETELCLPFIRRHIELVAPKLLVLLGGTAAGTLLETSEGITRLRGRWRAYTVADGEIPTMPTYHPAYLLRQPAHKALAWRDFLTIKNRLNSDA